jgi:hypothetical protein
MRICAKKREVMDQNTARVNLFITLRAQGSTQTIRRKPGSSRMASKHRFSSNHVLRKGTRDLEENKGLFFRRRG